MYRTERARFAQKDRGPIFLSTGRAHDMRSNIEDEKMSCKMSENFSENTPLKFSGSDVACAGVHFSALPSHIVYHIVSFALFYIWILCSTIQSLFFSFIAGMYQ